MKRNFGRVRAMGRRDFVKLAGGAVAGAAVLKSVPGQQLNERSYDSATISIRLVEDQPGVTSLILTEHGDATYVLVEAFYWTTQKINGRDVRLLLHKETTTPLSKGANMMTDLPMTLASIVFLRVKEMSLLKQTEFGERPA
jgi:hypothetical protein